MIFSAIEKNDDPFFYQHLGLRRGLSFTRGVKMGPYSVTHPQYLLSPEYLRVMFSDLLNGLPGHELHILCFHGDCDGCLIICSLPVLFF